MQRTLAETDTQLTPFLKYLMAVGCGVIVANIYYCQPLLGEFARTFHASDERASVVNICTQLGYGIGLLFLVPLGDKLERKKLIFNMHLLAALSMLGAATAGSLNGLFFFSICIGISSTACQVFIPLAAHLASEEERGNVVGIMMGGLLTGILASRTLSGIVAEYWGWRSLYAIGAGLMVAMSMVVRRFLPQEKPSFEGSYMELMGSLWQLFRQQRVVRESAFLGALLFAAISGFWSTMAFFLEKPPYQYSLSVIGLFGLIGAGGAMVSPFIGKTIDRKGPFIPMKIGVVVMLIGYLILLAGRYSIWYMVLGIILLDMGLQSAHVPNLSRNYALLPEARTRLNTIYMTVFFVGGTLGSTLGSLAWNSGAWAAVCANGIVLVLAGIWMVYFYIRKTLPQIKGN